ncbi:1-phosphofructokinase family hexose kinase [Rathayibacter soli]|uniref:1-phosphofructokinase family hexose kinase n=1 Tax=Rathayibacter soli TaxID=3144168 RepID=UPI0027E42593|nr:PfkB family carbohydrate kinase [Glaciibacter superstes]
MSVVTVTPAGAIDLTYRVDTLRRGDFIRSQSSVREISGKGVNVAVALATGGMDAAAVVVLGSEDASLAAASPHADVLRPVFLPGQTRINTQIVDAGGVTTKVNGPVRSMTARQWQHVVNATDAEIAATSASWLVVGGSLPAVDGQLTDIRSLTTTASARGLRVAVDTSGEPLRHLIADPAGIDLIKPNVHELSDALGGLALRTLGDVVEAARVVIARGIDLLYVSIGADGALVVSHDTVVHAVAHAQRLASTAGAGDASLAGFILGAGSAVNLDLVAGCTMAARFGTLAVSQQATLVTSLRDLPDAVTTVDPEPTWPLAEPAG